eukprot:gnl/TRDRNA2_/TRDRNA2_131790_c0_seq8.p1 gnl/TRDRNA2_/TRDRNA2_131790_c0~~gnl/TRDRNA2_/TRDRNA2_131790_c0_seq8.p1  ORF type:complete len:376 (-),score=89.55 gnl/TRDRNA2_/TRDRNA2_131790_c0_seq8:219-1346(-)
MEISTGASSSTSTLCTTLAEAMNELLLMVISTLAWLYFEDIRKFVRNLWSRWNVKPRPKAADLIVKQAKCSHHEDIKFGATSLEHEPEAEIFPTQKTVRTPTNVSPIELESSDLSEPESQDKINGNHYSPPGVLLLPEPVLLPPPGLELPGFESPDGEKASKRKKNSKPKPQPIEKHRELARCVCWKDSFGFLVDENGSRLFIRQTDVEGEKPLLAGQLVLFRRAEQPARGTPKGRDVVLVDIEMAKILRAAEREGMQWSTFMKGVLDDDPKLLSSFKSLQNTASHKGKLANFKTEVLGLSKKTEAVKKTNEATKGSVSSGAKIQPSRNEMATAKKDDDLKAFLGSGSIEDMRANLKYAPQWVTDKFNAQYGVTQ